MNISISRRDIHGAYLAPIGSKAVLKSRSTTVTRDELFSLEESLPQASFVAALNQRYVSVKQGRFLNFTIARFFVHKNANLLIIRRIINQRLISRF